MKKNIIKKLAKLGAKHKLVPFLGAGCSIPHLTYDWDDIRDDLMEKINIDCKDHLKVAQKYINEFGKEKFCNYLKDKFLIDEFNDNKGYSYLAIMSWQLGVIYTTNQDNVMEKCFEKYGRNYSKIVELEDLGYATPGDKLFIKFHGDLSIPESVVFGLEDYNNRIEDYYNFLNIRLRSDLLAKNLIFIGYSLRDKDIQFLLKELEEAFDGKLPQSYMIAWEYSDELQKICNEHGIKLIDPLKIFTQFNCNEVAFEKFLSELVEEILKLKTSNQIDHFFRSSTPPTRKVVTKFEIESVCKVVEKSDFKEGCEKFRAVFDRSLIPKDFESKVVNIFRKLSKKCSNMEESELLNGAAFNLCISKPINNFKILVSMMVTANVRNSTNIFDSLHISVKEIPDEIYILAVPVAIEILADWNREITDIFRSHVTSWIDRSIDYKELNEDYQKYLKEWIDFAWNDHTIYENPLKRQQRLKSLNLTPKSKRMSKRMMNLIPKKYGKPYEG